MKFTSAANLVEKEAHTVKVQFNPLMPSLGILVSACAGHPKNDEILSAVRSACYAVESCRGGSYCVTGGTPESLEGLANEIRAAYAGETAENGSKLSKLVQFAKETDFDALCFEKLSLIKKIIESDDIENYGYSADKYGYAEKEWDDE